MRVSFLLKVKADMVEEYRGRHAAVWPDMLAALREHGWRNYSLFLRPDGSLVGYFETDDLAGALAGMAATDVNTRWQNEMARFFEGNGAPDEGIVPLTEVFHLD
jgi:L-rhamnose mutarotase